MTTEQKVATEVAEEEFARWASGLDIDTDTSKMDEEDRKEFEILKGAVIHAMECGRVVIDEKTQAVYTPRDGLEQLVFREPRAKTILKAKANQSEAQRVLMLACDMTANPEFRFEGMLVRDYKVVRALVLLLLASR